MTPAKFAVRYSRALKFSEQWTDHGAVERQGFENAIDSDPLNPQHHLAYSDWLRDRGEDGEADFRKSLGEWFLRGGYSPPQVTPSNPMRAEDVYLENYTHGVPLSIGPDNLPEGVSTNNLSYTYDPNYPGVYETDATTGRTSSVRRASTDTDAFYHQGSGVNHAGHFLYKNYRGMEGAFRRAFMANRNKQSPLTPPTE